jgi:hypothetical protein
MTAAGFVVAVLLLAVMSLREVRHVGAGEVGTGRSSWLLRAQLLLILGCVILVLPRALGLLT